VVTDRSARFAACANVQNNACPTAADGKRTVGLVCDAEIVVAMFDAELWIWDARRADSWTFVSLPAELSDEIRELADGPRRGFGSLRVRITVGGSTWTTSIFPDGRRNCYVLPVKRAVRKAEGLDAGDIATVTVELMDL
jgi:hypothetical protein